jgi:hypothetical protein
MNMNVDITNLPATRTDPVQPTRDLARLPMISAEQYQHVDVSGTLTIDDAITRLEKLEPAVDAEFTELPQYDL